MSQETRAFASPFKILWRLLTRASVLRLAAHSLLLLVMPVAASQAAEYQPGVHRHPPEPTTASGDISSVEMCSKGEYLVDFTGRAGAWIDRIGLRCAAVLPSGGMGEPHGTQGSGLGGGGGAEITN